MSVCKILQCGANIPPDVETYSIQSNVRFNGTPLTVIVDCPPGVECLPGDYPITIVLPPGGLSVPGNANWVVVCGITIPLTGTDADFQAIAKAIAQCGIVSPPQPGGGGGNVLFPFTRSIPIFGQGIQGSCLGAELEAMFVVDKSMKMASIASWEVFPIPSGMAVEILAGNAGVRLYGTPAAVGQYVVTVRVNGSYIDPGQQNPVASVGSLTFAFNVAEVANVTPPIATVGSPYSTAMAVNGPTTGSEVWFISDGELPPGLFLAPNGVISGTPTVAGSYAFTVCYQNTL